MSEAGTPPRARPPGPANRVRPKRIVTFVIDAKCEQLEALADTRKSSLSAVVHQLVMPGLRA